MLSNTDFVHCHVHSNYSSFDGMVPLNKLVLRAREMGFESLALTDHGNIGGLINFINECKSTKTKKGEDIPYPTIKPLLGCEMYLSRDMSARSKDEQPRKRKGNHHLILIAKNYEGYKNLCILSNRSFLNGFYMDPRIDFDLLSNHSRGLICSSACLAGIINTQLCYNGYDKAKKICSIFKDIFGEDFFLEVMYHGIRSEVEIMSDIFRISKELGVPVIATNDVHYLEKNQARSHEVFLAMSTKKCIKDPKRLQFPYDEFYLKSAAEMEIIFSSISQVLTNTKTVAV